tara:strand:+ start:2153 stop:2821 length:669 start_codon:yes stop_codon:yes gene_type:complete
MANRFPLIVDSSSQQIKELPDGDSLLLGDSEKLKIGDDQDLELYHDGSNGYLVNTTGDLYIRDSGGDIYIQAKSGENSISAVDDGAVNLFYDGSAKVATTSTGATVTGLLTATTSANITQVALTSSSNAVAWDARAAANAYHLTTENTTFAAPSNAVEGAIISVEIAQGSTARTIAWNTVFEFAASTAPTVTATANKTDIFAFRYNGSVWQEIGRVQNMAQT